MDWSIRAVRFTPHRQSFGGSRHAFYLALSQASRVLGPGLAFIVLATAWSPDTFGRFASLYSLSYLLTFLPAAGAVAYVLDQAARHPQRFQDIRRFGLITAGSGILLLPPAALFIGVHSGTGDVLLFSGLSVFALLSALNEVEIASHRARLAETPVVLSAIAANATLLATAATVASVKPEPYAALLWLISGWMLTRFVQRWFLARCNRRHIQSHRLNHSGRKQRRGILAAGDQRLLIPYLASNAAGVVYAHGDVLLVRLVLGEAAAGLYTAVARLLQISSMACHALAQWFQPRLARLQPESRQWRHQRQNLILALTCLTVTGALGFTLGGSRLLTILFGPEYASAGSIMFLAAAALAGRCLVAALWIEHTARQMEAARARQNWLLNGIFLASALPLASLNGGAGVMAAHAVALGLIAIVAARGLSHARQQQSGTVKHHA